MMKQVTNNNDKMIELVPFGGGGGTKRKVDTISTSNTSHHVNSRIFSTHFFAWIMLISFSLLVYFLCYRALRYFESDRVRVAMYIASGFSYIRVLSFKTLTTWYSLYWLTKQHNNISTQSSQHQYQSEEPHWLDTRHLNSSSSLVSSSSSSSSTSNSEPLDRILTSMNITKTNVAKYCLNPNDPLQTCQVDWSKWAQTRKQFMQPKEKIMISKEHDNAVLRIVTQNGVILSVEMAENTDDDNGGGNNIKKFYLVIITPASNSDTVANQIDDHGDHRDDIDNNHNYQMDMMMMMMMMNMPIEYQAELILPLNGQYILLYVKHNEANEAYYCVIDLDDPNLTCKAMQQQ